MMQTFVMDVPLSTLIIPATQLTAHHIKLWCGARVVATKVHCDRKSFAAVKAPDAGFGVESR